MNRNTKKIIFSLLAAAVGLLLAVAVLTVTWFSLMRRTNGTMVSSGEARKYLLHVPKTYDPSRPVPLVISLHPAALGATAQMNTSGWNKLADEHGFIVVYPAAVGALSIWHAQKPGHALDADVQFISDLIEMLQSKYKIDPARIYLNGFSNGGGMAFVVSCRLGRKLAAVGEVASAQLIPPSWCSNSTPVPMIAFHGTADRLAPYYGGQQSSGPLKQRFVAVRDWVGDWAHRNNCQDEPTEDQVATGVTRAAYRNCAEDSDVVLYTITGGNHSWPGGKPLLEWMVGPPTNRIDATAVMWEFFVHHPRQISPPSPVDER